MIAQIRAAREEDAAFLPDIERSAAQSFRTLPGLGWVAAAEVLGEAVHIDRIRGGTCWVAVDGHDNPVGFLSAERAGGGELHIHEMSVAQAFQGKGAGRALLQAAIDWAGTKGLHTITLTTFRAIPWNAPFYGRFGFAMLAPAHLDERLASLLGDEIASGFPEGSRCAMRLSLTNSTGPISPSACPRA